MAETVRTPTGLLSFPHVFDPRRPAEHADPRYSLVLIFDKDAQGSPEYKKLCKAVYEAAREKWGDKANAMIDNGQLRLPFRDASEKSGYAGYEDGRVFVSAWSKQRPGIVDARRNEVMVPDDVWPGQLARITCRPFAYENSGNKGVSLGLNNIQIVSSDMPRLDGKKKASEDFDAIDEGRDEDDPFE